MHIEFRHLRTIRAIHRAGGVARAAERLSITQSALSHQLKGLEDQCGVELFVRRTKPLRLSSAGMKLLRLADEILPRIEALEDEFAALIDGKSGRLHIAMECHACFEWLLPVLDMFRQSWTDVDLDIRPGLAFGALQALEKEEVDLVISSDPDEIRGLSFTPLFDYEPRLVVAKTHPLATKPVIEPEDFRTQTLLTYPMEPARLDVFSGFLDPAGVDPRAVRQVELTAMILMLVAAGRGVTVLPDWVLREVGTGGDLVTRSLGENGLTKRLFAATRSEDVTKPFMAHFLRLARTEPVKWQRDGRDA